MLDPKIREAWHESAKAGSPPDISIFSRLELGNYNPWHIQEGIFDVGRRFLSDRTKIDYVCREMTRGGGKSVGINALRIWLAEWRLPYATDTFGHPLRSEQKVIALVGRNEDALRDVVMKELKETIVTKAPWLRTDDWLTYVGDPANPDPHGLKAIANLPSKGAQKWEAYRLDLTNGVTFLGRSIKQSVRGLHGLVVDCDDLLNEGNAAESQEMYDLLMSSHAKTLEPGGLLMVLGTPQHPGDFYDIIASSGRFDYKQYPAYDVHRTLGYYEKNKAILDATGNKQHFANLPVEDRYSLWPSRLSWAFLQQDRGTTPDDEDRYLRERLLQRVTVNTSLVRPEYIKAALSPDLSYHLSAEPGHRYYLGHDPSSLKKDNAVWCVGYVLPGNVVVPAYFSVLSADPHLADGQGETMVVKELNMVAKQFDYPDGIVESNGMQGLLTVVGRLIDPSMLSKLTKFPLGRNKHTEAGWLGIRTIFRMGKVRLPYKTAEDRAITDAFVSELRSIQYKGGEIVEHPTIHNDRVSAFFLMLQATREAEVVYSASSFRVGKASQTAVDARLSPPNFAKPFSIPAQRGELAPPSSRPAPGSISDIRARLAKWDRRGRA